MIQVNGTIRLANQGSEEAVAALVTLMEKSRAEDGCIDYTFASDLSDPLTMVLFERWRDAEALAAHSQSAHVAEFQKVMAANPPAERNIRMYVTDEGQPL